MTSEIGLNPTQDTQEVFMKRTFILALVLAISSFALTGCSGSDSGGDKGKTPASTENKTSDGKTVETKGTE